MEPEQLAGKKRKRSSAGKEDSTHSVPSNEDLSESDISRLEEEILQSRKHYNNIVKLHSVAFSQGQASDSAITALLALCRIFSRLLAEGSFTKTKTTSNSELVVLQWLDGRYQEFRTSLAAELSSNSNVAPDVITRLVMQLVKHEVNALGPELWKDGFFSSMLEIYFDTVGKSASSRAHFIRYYVAKYDDVRFYTLEMLP